MKKLCFLFCFTCLAQNNVPEVDCEQLLLKKYRDAIVMFLREDRLSDYPIEQHHEVQKRKEQAEEDFNLSAYQYRLFCQDHSVDNPPPGENN